MEYHQNSIDDYFNCDEVLTNITNSEPGRSLADKGKIAYSVFYVKLNSRETLKRGCMVVTKQRIIVNDENNEVIIDCGNIGNKTVFQVDERIQILNFDIEIDTQLPVNREVEIGKDFKKNDRGTPNSASDDLDKIFIPFGACVLDQEKKIFIDRDISNKLRDYQKEGVIFMYNCISGKVDKSRFGCILADSMGLGKTITTLSLVYSVTGKTQMTEVIRKIIIITPNSLLENWKNEIDKYFGFKIKYRVYNFQKQKDYCIEEFKRNIFSCLLISYESFGALNGKLDSHCDLIICDEGHQLKNHNTKKFKSINNIQTKRRIILTGTPLQNNLTEFYNCINLVNPDFFGCWELFKNRYVDDIVAAQQPKASDSVVQMAREKSIEIWNKTKQFILRRTCDIIAGHLPPRHEYIVLIDLLPLQTQLYLSYLGSDIVDEAKKGKFQEVFALITTLRKIVNHPDLIFKLVPGNSLLAEHARAKAYFPEDYNSVQSRVGYSKKLEFTLKIANFAYENHEKIIVASNWNKTLDIIGIELHLSGLDFLRLDGSTPTQERQKIINLFNEKNNFSALLLNCKAGGVGLNVCGASRMVLFDDDWNPKNDQQVMARIWRTGQKKEVHIYRLVTVGTIEEKIYQRQKSKESLSLNIVDQTLLGPNEQDFLRHIFDYKTEVESFKSGDKVEDLAKSWLDNLTDCFNMVKEVEAEWQKVNKGESEEKPEQIVRKVEEILDLPFMTSLPEINFNYPTTKKRKT